MTLAAPQWGALTDTQPSEPKTLDTEATAGKKSAMKSEKPAVTINGAEQLFLAARDYGVRVCFANPGMYMIVRRRARNVSMDATLD